MSKFIAGIIDHQQNDDPVYGDIEAAIQQAQTLSWTDSVCAVWEVPEGKTDEDSEIVVLVYQQVVYRRDDQ